MYGVALQGLCPEIKLEKAVSSGFACLFIHAVFCAHLTEDSVFYIQMEGRICFTSWNCWMYLVGFWVIPQKFWSIHWAQSWSQDGMHSQQCTNRGRKCGISRETGLCVGYRLCTFVQEEQNSSGIYLLVYVSEDSWDRSNLCLLCKWCEGQGNDKSRLLC